MGQVIQTNGDYNIKSGEGATINLDTGFGVGTVRVTGNLLIQGNTLTVSTEDLNIRDNIIIVNYGETGDGVTLEYSGMQVDRGIADPAMFLYDERADAWLLGYQHDGLFTYDNSKLRKSKNDNKTRKNTSKSKFDEDTSSSKKGKSKGKWQIWMG